jgi:Asp-tRNA(Asn)/Glu-tRNA(Gln) amidotransferase A subunit family amidase
MARTAQDLQLLFEITAGFDAGDPVAVSNPVEWPDAQQTKQLRVGFYEDDGYSPPTPETRAAVRAAAAALRDAGFAVEPFRPEGLDRARELWTVIFVEAIAMVLNPMVKGRESDISENLKEFLAIAAERPPLTGERLLHTLLERDQVRFELLIQMDRFPILLAPVCTIPAFRHEDAGWGPRHAADYLRTMTYCQHYNILGNPGAVVPVGKSPEGLPIGVQIVGRPYKEEEVLAVAAVLDKQFGFKQPPI